MIPLDLIWTIVGFILTLLIFSYLLGDNPLFRLATYLFIGVTAGYVAVVILYQVLIPKLLWPILIGSPTEKILTAIALLLSLLLLAKFFPSISSLGNIPMAYLVGSGAAVIIGGAVMGTILTQSQATIAAFDTTSVTANSNPLFQLAEALFILVGAVTTLAYFHFGARAKQNQATGRGAILGSMAGIGQIFIAITLGALFAGVVAASLTALIERLGFLWNVISANLL